MNVELLISFLHFVLVESLYYSYTHSLVFICCCGSFFSNWSYRLLSITDFIWLIRWQTVIPADVVSWWNLWLTLLRTVRRRRLLPWRWWAAPGGLWEAWRRRCWAGWRSTCSDSGPGRRSASETRQKQTKLRFEMWFTSLIGSLFPSVQHDQTLPGDFSQQKSSILPVIGRLLMCSRASCFLSRWQTPSHPLEVVDDVSWVSVIKLGHGDVDELHLLHLQHLDPLLQLPQLELVRHLRLLLQNQCSQLNEQSHSLGDVSTVGSSEHLEAGNILGFFSLKNQNNKLKIKRTTPSAID